MTEPGFDIEVEATTPAEVEHQESIFEGIVQVDLPSFKGPIDVLCFLLRRGELDTKKISAIEVADQVFRVMPQLAGHDIVGAGSSLYYDALLLEVKSALLGKMGLPEVKMVQPEDPELQAVAREYDRFAMMLRRRYQTWFGRFPRGEAAGDKSKPLAQFSDKTKRTMYELYKAIVLRPQPSLRVLPQAQESIGSRREQVIHKLPLHEPKTLRDLWQGEAMIDKVLIFLTLLELATQQIVIIEQDDGDGEIVITRVKTPIVIVEVEDEPEPMLPFDDEAAANEMKQNKLENEPS